ncbi:hypothetical protein Tco_1146290 [Tanacetum coccineum]
MWIFSRGVVLLILMRQESNALFESQDLCLRQELLEYMGIHDNDASESSHIMGGKNGGVVLGLSLLSMVYEREQHVLNVDCYVFSGLLLVTRIGDDTILLGYLCATDIHLIITDIVRDLWKVNIMEYWWYVHRLVLITSQDGLVFGQNIMWTGYECVAESEYMFSDGSVVYAASVDRYRTTHIIGPVSTLGSGTIVLLLALVSGLFCNQLGEDCWELQFDDYKNPHEKMEKKNNEDLICKVMRTLASVEIEIMLILGLPCCLSSSSVRCLENVVDSRSSQVPVPLPEDPDEAIRQTYLDGTDTESITFEDPIETKTPETARMVVSVPPAMSPGLFASMAEVAAMSESTFCKRFRSSYESSLALSPPDLPSRKHYRGDYDLWSTRMEQYLTHTNYALWEVIINGDAPTVASASAEGPIPPKIAEQKLARKNKLKAKITLLLAIADEHLLKFHEIKDAKTLWEAIKARFQKLISQLEIHSEVISHEDENLKLLRSLPSAWNNIALIMRNKSEIKGQSNSSSNSQNVAFVSSENTSNTN